MDDTADEILKGDAAHVWHPYSAASSTQPPLPVIGARGVELELADGRILTDGMSSWWCAIHGYNHPSLNAAAHAQLDRMSHVMFGGLTHPSAVDLCQKLVALTHDSLSRVFLSDSGSVAVEVAIKMALQYWHGKKSGPRNRMLTVRNGYHGDTFGAMAVCDPDTGMHHLFTENLTPHFFAPAPPSGFTAAITPEHTSDIESILREHHNAIAAVILEPVVQGAGGMRFYSPAYLQKLRDLCDHWDVLLIFDEIATGFGRTGKMFALEHAGVVPDILCLGKALTGGYLSLAATLCSEQVANDVSEGGAGAFMHGPTFMGNPLACAVACASIDLLLATPWEQKVASIESWLQQGLEPAKALAGVHDVRVLGAIGVIELVEPCDMHVLQSMLIEQGIWIRPFGRLVYTMPPFIVEQVQAEKITAGMVAAVTGYLEQLQK